MPYAYHLGIDLHKEFGYWTLLNDQKEVIFKGKVTTKETSVRKAVESLGVTPKKRFNAPSSLFPSGAGTRTFSEIRAFT